LPSSSKIEASKTFKHSGQMLFVSLIVFILFTMPSDDLAFEGLKNK